MTAPFDREAIRQRAEKATSGPWSASHDSVWGADGDCVFEAHHPLDSGEWNDCVFAAHAREDIPALLSALEAADAEIAKSKRDLEWGSELARAEIADLKGIIQDREDICTIQAGILAKHHGCGESMETRCAELYDETVALRAENERLGKAGDDVAPFGEHLWSCSLRQSKLTECNCGWTEAKARLDQLRLAPLLAQIDEVNAQIKALQPPAPSAPGETT